MIFEILFLAVYLFIYFPWFEIAKTLTSGDWPYLFLQNIQVFKIPTESPFLWLEPYYQITAKLGVQVFSLSWEMTEKIFWFFPFLAVSLVSSYFFLKYLSKQLKIDGRNLAVFISLGCLIFTTNTYILMLVGGGQMGVAMAYSLIPLVLWVSFLIINDLKFSIRKIILSSLTLGVQLMFDPRIFLLTMFIIFLYFLFTFATVKDKSIGILKRIILVLVLTGIVNLFWVLPNLSYLNSEYASVSNIVAPSFLSFATFSNSIALLHPNWPENIFGKIGFMKPEFIIIPILGFISLLFARKNKILLFFAFIGIVGAFLAKGANPPFGEIYIWLSNVPGFMAFRDPTKFYVFIVASYMVLIPYSLCKFSKKVSRARYWVSNIFILAFFAYWLFLIRPAVLGQLTGTFKPHDVPSEYVKLKDFLNAQSGSSKTLWVPSVERFGFSSKNHFAISSAEFFKVSSLSGVLRKIEMSNTRVQLEESDVKYVIVPYDYLKEIFITDRKYDEKLYIETVNTLKNINWLSNLERIGFGKIKVFEVIY